MIFNNVRRAVHGVSHIVYSASYYRHAFTNMDYWLTTAVPVGEAQQTR